MPLAGLPVAGLPVAGVRGVRVCVTGTGIDRARVAPVEGAPVALVRLTGTRIVGVGVAAVRLGRVRIAGVFRAGPDRGFGVAVVGGRLRRLVTGRCVRVGLVVG